MTSIVMVGVLFIVLFILSIVLKRITIEGDRVPAIWSTLSLIAGIVIPLLIVVLSSFTLIPPGTVGVVSIFGKVQEKPLYSGFNIVSPISEVTKMSVQVLKDDSDYDAASKDMQVVHIKTILNYSLIPERAPMLFQDVGHSYETIIIIPAAQEILKANTALHNASEILQLRPKIKDDVQQQLRTLLNRYGIELREVSLANVSFGGEYTHAIELKQIQEQTAEQKKYELIRTQREAEINQARAKGDADAFREAAKGRADALKIEAEAQANYNTKVAESLTQALIQAKYLEKWNGQLPNFMLGDKAIPLFQVPNQK